MSDTIAYIDPTREFGRTWLRRTVYLNIDLSNARADMPPSTSYVGTVLVTVKGHPRVNARRLRRP